MGSRPFQAVSGCFHNSHCTTEPIGHDRPDLASFFAAPTSILAAPGASWRRLCGPSGSNLDGQTSKTTNSAAEGYQNQENRTFVEMSSKSRSRYHGKSIQRAKNDAQGATWCPKGAKGRPKALPGPRKIDQKSRHVVPKSIKCRLELTT